MSQQYKIRFNPAGLAVILISLLVISPVIAQEYWQSTEGPYGGPVECIVYNSFNEAFAFTHWGGLFYSANNGDNWVKRGDRLATKVIIDSNDVIITNELYSASINRSMDNGQTWTRYANVIDATHVCALAVNSANFLFAGTNSNGIFRSEDGGATWTRIINGMTYKQVNAISTYGARIYIGTTGGKVFRSADNGENWDPASTGINEVDVYSILHVSSGILLAGTGSTIYRSDNNGDDWTLVAAGLAYVNNFVKVTDLLIYAATDNGIYRSDDGGQTWYPINEGLGNTGVMSLAVSSADVLLAGTYYGFDNGIYRSEDYGNLWHPVNYGLRGVRIWKMAAAPNGIIYAGAYNSGMFRSIDNGYTWQPIYNGLKAHASSKSYNIRALTVSSEGTVYIGTYGAGVFRSYDNGVTWTQVISGLPTWISGLACGQTPGLLYAGTYSDGIYKSTNYGSSWAYTGTPADTFIAYDLMVSTDENIIFAGSAENNYNNILNGLWGSPDGGTTWHEVGTGDLINANVREIIANSSGDIFVATSDFGIFRSTDGGTNWDNPDQGLLSDFFLGLAVNKLDHVFAGGGGVYVSKNNGDNWSYLPQGMPDVQANTLAISPSGDIFCGTQNGIYKSLRPTTQVTLRFSVKMLFASGFNPITDTVAVRGNFNNWGSAGDNVYFDPVISDPDVTFIGSFTTDSPDTLEGWIAGDTVRYKFLFKNAGGENWESDVANRTAFWDHTSDLDLPAVWFNAPANNSDDSTALAALYNSTGGSSWTNDENWLTDRPFSKWYGVYSDANGQVITLVLENNNLTGAIPTTINLLQKMRDLSLFGNHLSGSIPVEIGQLQNLSYISLWSNNLSGNIPSEIGDLNKLVGLHLGLNDLTGSIPASLGNLTSLEELHLESNQLTGTVPVGIWNLIKLKSLFLNNNQLTGTLPANLGNLSQLTHLYLENNQFSGSIPSEISNLTNLIFLQLYNNQLTGSIPTTIGNLSNLEYLRVNGNQLDRSIPLGIGSLKKLREIDLHFNQLSGAVPNVITGIDSLRILYLQSNKFTDLPNLTAMTLLEQLEVQNNRLTFEDLESNITMPNFVYSPQDSVGNAVDTSVYANGNISFNVEVGGANNLYQWYHNGILVSGATSNVFNIYLAHGEDGGFYTCQITNNVVPNLVLYRRPIRLVVEGAAPPPPVLLSPPDGGTGIASNPTLTWDPPVGAGTVKYHLQVHTSSDFDMVPLYFDKDSIDTAFFTLSNLSSGVKYHWRVAAWNEFDISGWSAVWNFTTATGAAPNPPVLSTPANNAGGVSIFPTLTWTAEIGTYQIQIDNDGNVNSPFVDTDTLTQQQFTIRDRGLAFSSQHYWRVAVTVGGTKSGWSEIRNFTTESYPIYIQLQNTTSFPTKNSPGDFVSTDYRIFGIPGNDFAPLSDIGGQAGVNWQAYWDNGQSANYLVKFDKSGIFNCITGRAFWLVSNGAVTVYMMASTAPLNSDQQAEIDVHPGWNLITDPFPFPVSWDFIKQANQIDVPLWSFTGNVGSLWTQVGSLQPYVGYYFDNVTNLSKLRVPYKSALGKSIAVAAKQWQLTVSIESEGLKESSTQLGVAEDALAGWDRHDYRKPRSVTGGLPGVYFNRPQWDESYGVFATDFRPPIDKIERWSIMVTATAGQKVLLAIIGIEEIPAGHDIYLLDKEHLCSVDLRRQNTYAFIAALAENEFEIMVGDRQAIEQELEAILPQQFGLGQNYPNPFNPQTTIPVILPQQARISLKIYNMLGQEIKKLFEGTRNTGKHFFFWDGSDQAGKKMPSGVYLYRLTTDGDFNSTGKMVLIK